MAVNNKCVACGRKFKDGDNVIPIRKYVTNERRGDFITTVDKDLVHARHIVEAQNLRRVVLLEAAGRLNRDGLSFKEGTWSGNDPADMQTIDCMVKAIQYLRDMAEEG